MLTLIEFRHEDEMDTVYLRDLPRTEHFGDRKFPSPTTYRDAVVAETLDSDPSERARHYAEAQRDWHVRGQTGCQFARLVAKDAEVTGWDYAVFDGGSQQTTASTIAELNAQVRDAIARPETQVLSFLMPQVMRAQDAVWIIRQLAEGGAFWLERDEMTDDGLALYLRYPVEEGIQAWIMARSVRLPPEHEERAVLRAGYPGQTEAGLAVPPPQPRPRSRSPGGCSA